jgi:hypothetical protein
LGGKFIKFDHSIFEKFSLKRSPMSDELTRHVFKFYIAKAAASAQEEQVKVASISEAALDILADVAIYRLTTWSREIRALLDHSGRTEPNGYDVFAVLARYRENMTSLGQYIIDKQFAADLNVRPYPLPGGVKFPSADQSEAFPFRASAPIAPLPSEPSLTHIPGSFPSPFGDAGIASDDDVQGTTLLRKESDRETILASMKDQRPERSEEIKLDCQLVHEIVRAVLAETE